MRAADQKVETNEARTLSTPPDDNALLPIPGYCRFRPRARCGNPATRYTLARGCTPPRCLRFSRRRRTDHGDPPSWCVSVDPLLGLFLLRHGGQRHAMGAGGV